MNAWLDFALDLLALAAAVGIPLYLLRRRKGRDEVETRQVKVETESTAMATAEKERALLQRQVDRLEERVGILEHVNERYVVWIRQNGGDPAKIAIGG